MEPLTVIALGIVIFGSTNVDDLFVLLAFFSDSRFAPRDIVIGQFAGIGILFFVSLLMSLVSLVIPPAYIGLLGFAPILIGAKKIMELRRGSNAEIESQRGPDAVTNLASVAVVTVANGGDNLGIYVPVFATHSGWQIGIIGFVFAVLTGVWCLTAYGMVHHPRWGAPIRRYGKYVTPFVLIGLGISILYTTRAFDLLKR